MPATGSDTPAGVIAYPGRNYQSDNIVTFLTSYSAHTCSGVIAVLQYYSITVLQYYSMCELADRLPTGGCGRGTRANRHGTRGPRLGTVTEACAQAPPPPARYDPGNKKYPTGTSAAFPHGFVNRRSKKGAYRDAQREPRRFLVA